MDINTTNILNYAIQNGMINMESIQEQVMKSERKRILDEYVYRIWVGDDGFARTYVPEPNKPSGRRMVKRKSLKEIEDMVIELVCEKGIRKEKQTLLSLFPQWMKFKEAHTNSTSTLKRITAEWHRYYENQKEFINTPIEQFTKAQLDEWAHNMIKTHNMTKKAYYNMSMILRQELDWAVDNNLLKTNPFALVKINSKLFCKQKKKDPETQVYLTDETPLMITELLKKFQKNPKNTTPLMILFAFETGLRIGELVALRVSDIAPDWSTIHIQRQEIRDYEKVDDNGFVMRLKGFKIVEYTKTETGDRFVYLTETAKKLIQYSLNTNKTYDFVDEDFIFVNENGRIGQYAISSRLIKACKAINIPTKSSHKIRKTYISTLIDHNVNIDEIRRQVGHSDERTTYSSYCFNRSTKNETVAQLENALQYNYSGNNLTALL